MKNTTGVETLLPLELLIKGIDPFDADRLQPQASTFEEGAAQETDYERGKDLAFNPAIDRYSEFNYYHRHLADDDDDPDCVTSSFIIGYIRFVFSRQANKMNTAYTIEHRVQTNIAGHNDDSDPEDVFTESDMLTVFNDEINSSTDFKTNIDNLAYHLKRLFIFGNSIGVNILSFLAAIAKAYDTKEKQTTYNLSHGKPAPTYTISMNKAIEEGIYECDSDGNLLGQFTVAQKSNRILTAWRTYVNMLPEYQTYLIDMRWVERLVDVLHIDLKTVDVSKFTPEFYNSLVITKFIKDNQYLITVKSRLDANVKNKPIDVLVSDGPSDFERTLLQIQSVFEQDAGIHNYYEQKMDSSTRKKTSEELFDTIKSYNMAFCHNERDLSKLSYVNDILYLGNEPFYLYVSKLSPEYLNLKKAIVTSYGLIYAITPADLYYIDYVHFHDIMYHVYEDNEPITKRQEEYWRKVT